MTDVEASGKKKVTEKKGSEGGDERGELNRIKGPDKGGSPGSEGRLGGGKLTNALGNKLQGKNTQPSSRSNRNARPLTTIPLRARTRRGIEWRDSRIAKREGESKKGEFLSKEESLAFRDYSSDGGGKVFSQRLSRSLDIGEGVRKRVQGRKVGGRRSRAKKGILIKFSTRKEVTCEGCCLV